MIRKSSLAVILFLLAFVSTAASAPTITVRIRVVDDVGAPVPGARVEIRHRDRQVAAGTMGSGRSLSFAEIPAGYDTRVRATCPGYVPAEDTLDDLDPRDAVLRLRRGVPFRGTVVAHEGRPVVGAEVFVRHHATGHIRTRTDPGGRFSLPAVPRGELVDVLVEAGKDGWARYDEIIVAPGRPFDVRLPRVRKIRGRVVDAGGNGIPGLTVESRVGIGLVSIHGFCADGSRRDGRTGVTEEQGWFLLDGLTRNYGNLRVLSKDWKIVGGKARWDEGAPAPTVVVVGVEKRSDEVVKVPRRGRIRGRVVIEGPVLVAEVHARREVPSGSRGGYMDWNTTWCRPDGRFEFAGLAEAAYEISVEAVGSEELTHGEVEATVDRADEVVLRPVPLVVRRGRVVDEKGNAVPSADVGGRPVRPDGSFTTELTRDEEPRVRIWAPGFAPTSSSPPAGGEWVIRLDPVHVVEGVVLDADGRPIPSVRLYNRSLTGDTKADLAGRFRLTFAKAGPRSLLPSADGHRFAGHVEFETGDRDVVIRAVRTTWLGGRVIGEQGAPIEGARVRVGERNVATDADGRFRFEDLAGSSFRVRVSLEDPVLGVRAVDGVPAGTADLVLRALRGQRIRGRVVYPDGRPAEYVEVEAHARGHDAPTRSARTNARGRFVIRGLLPGEWCLSVWDAEEDTAAWWETELFGVRPRDRGVVLILERCEPEQEDDDE